MRKTVIIHLSDIHFDNLDMNNNLINRLLEDLDIMKETVGKYDLLVITGDCIDRGKVDLFLELNKKINEVLKKCNLRQKNRTVIVAGNHDVSHENMWYKSIKKNHNDDYNKINEQIENDLNPIFKEFNSFIEKYGVPENGVGVKYFNIDNIIIRAILINSSWSTLAHNKYGELCIGESQLKIIKEKIDKRKQKYDITIACMHHPLDFFSYKERKKLEDFLYNIVKVDFILHGHVHEASFDSIFNMDTSTNIFCTGVSYKKTGEQSSRKDGMRYSIYEIDIDTKTVNVYLRATNEKGVFVGDNRLYSSVNKKGNFTIPMGNISECLLPIKQANREKTNSIFLNKEFVELLLKKEEMLYRYYCGMEAVIFETMLPKQKEDFKKFKTNWMNAKNIKSFNDNKEMDKCANDFNREQFEIFCMYALNNLNALFFKNHKDIRFLLRVYNEKTNTHDAMLAEGIYSSTEDLEKVKSFKWGSGMIYNSYQNKIPLLKSQNLKYHEDGNSNGIWKEYLTLAIDGIELHKTRDFIPLFSLNIATISLENESCLHALAMSSIYDKMQDVFKLFEYNFCKLNTLYDI